jgi:DNA-binding NarL/FixJ family response regulator
MKVLVVVEDDPDMRMLIRLTLALERQFHVDGEASTAAAALETVRRLDDDLDLIILDHFIDGDVMGLQAAPLLKAAAPSAKILLFTSHDLATEARREPAIEAYLSKSNLDQLVPTARRLLGLAPAA